MTLDRDIRVSPEQIRVAKFALRDEIKRRTRSIEKAEAARSAGQTIQSGTLDGHYRDRDAARSLLEVFDVAEQQLARQLAAAVGAEFVEPAPAAPIVEPPASTQEVIDRAAGVPSSTAEVIGRSVGSDPAQAVRCAREGRESADRFAAEDRAGEPVPDETEPEVYFEWGYSTVAGGGEKWRLVQKTDDPRLASERTVAVLVRLPGSMTRIFISGDTFGDFSGPCAARLALCAELGVELPRLTNRSDAAHARAAALRGGDYSTGPDRDETPHDSYTGRELEL
jgi:hypothetical protein